MGECLITRRGGDPYELPVLNGAYPANVTVVEAANASASFSVQMESPGKPAEYAYQWYLNGAKISGATNSGYTKTGLTAAKTYTLYCVVTNKAGTVTSRIATLTVKSAKPTYTYTGNHKLIDDGNYNWRIQFLTSGTLKFTELGNASQKGVDVFLVGGGGGGAMMNGGGGGYTKINNKNLATGTNYTVTIGAGGAGSQSGALAVAGGNTSALGFTAYGGKEGTHNNKGGNGGSGGAGNGSSLKGGTNGGNGEGNNPGVGQGTTTREFATANGTLYAAGGGTAQHLSAVPSNRGANTGDGGYGSGSVNSGPAWDSGSGASGIVIFRNKR